MSFSRGVGQLAGAVVFAGAIVITAPIWGSYWLYLKAADALVNHEMNSDKEKIKQDIKGKLDATFLRYGFSLTSIKNKFAKEYVNCAADVTSETAALVQVGTSYEVKEYPSDFSRAITKRDAPIEFSRQKFMDKLKDPLKECADKSLALSMAPSRAQELTRAFDRFSTLFAGKADNLALDDVMGAATSELGQLIKVIDFSKEQYRSYASSKKFASWFASSELTGITSYYSDMKLVEKTEPYAQCIAKASAEAELDVWTDYMFRENPYQTAVSPYKIKDKDVKILEDQSALNVSISRRHMSLYSSSFEQNAKKCHPPKKENYQELASLYVASLSDPQLPSQTDVVLEKGYYGPKIKFDFSRVKAYLELEKDSLRQRELEKLQMQENAQLQNSDSNGLNFK